MRLIVATCSAHYEGRLVTDLPQATRLIVIKDDGTVLLHGATGSKPYNWMSPPTVIQVDGDTWRLHNPKTRETLTIHMRSVHHDSEHELGDDPGLVKDGAELQLQALLAADPTTLGDGYTLVRREHPTPIGPVDLLCRDATGAHVAVEVKRRGTIDGVEQLTRYLEFLNRDPLLTPVRGLFAAQQIAPQARTLAEDRGIGCVVVDYDALRGETTDNSTPTLF